MSDSTPVPLLCFRILAERSGKPAGLLLDVGDEAGAGLAAVVESDDMRELANRFACFYRPCTAPELAAAFQAAGWKEAAPGSLHGPTTASPRTPCRQARPGSTATGAWRRRPRPPARRPLRA